MSQYPVIYPEDALRYLKSRQQDGGVMLEDLRRTAGSGEAISRDGLEDLRAKLLRLKKKFPAKLRAKDPQGGKFESDACAIVHACVADVDRRALADHDFWTWLAVDYLADILEWRFGADGRPAQPANYGIGTRTENMFFRLWLRADLGRRAVLTRTSLRSSATKTFGAPTSSDKAMRMRAALCVRYSSCRRGS